MRCVQPLKRQYENATRGTQLFLGRWDTPVGVNDHTYLLHVSISKRGVLLMGTRTHESHTCLHSDPHSAARPPCRCLPSKVILTGSTPGSALMPWYKSREKPLSLWMAFQCNYKCFKVHAKTFLCHRNLISICQVESVLHVWLEDLIITNWCLFKAVRVSIQTLTLHYIWKVRQTRALWVFEARIAGNPSFKSFFNHSLLGLQGISGNRQYSFLIN